MKLNHLDLQVRDVGATANFFQHYFGLRVRSNPGSDAIAILTDDDGFVLVLQRSDAGETYPKDCHVGFLVDDVEVVRSLHKRATDEGATVSDVIVNGRGTMIYFSAPEGYRIEVSCQRKRFNA